MRQPVTIGIVGCGSVMVRYMSLIQQLRGQGLVDVIVACDVRAEKRQVMLDKFGVANFTTDYREVIQSDNVDLVLVLTSMAEHGPITRASLEAGKHVLVEKPMAVTLEEAQSIVELAQRSPGYLVCAPHIILSPTYQAMGERIARGDIGKVLSARARYGWSGPWWGQWYYRPDGGPLFDLGVYNITSLTGWLGPARRVIAMTSIAIPEREVEGERMRVEAEDNAHILLDFGEAVLGVVTTGFTMQQYRSPAIELYGNQGTMQMMGDDWAPQGYEMWQNQVGAWQIFKETAPHWPWTDGLRHLVECIQQNIRPMITPEHAYHVLEIMLKSLESGRDGKDRRIDSTFAPLQFNQSAGAIPAHRQHDPRGGR